MGLEIKRTTLVQVSLVRKTFSYFGRRRGYTRMGLGSPLCVNNYPSPRALLPYVIMLHEVDD